MSTTSIGTMMNVPLTLTRIADRCKRELAHVEVVSRTADKSIVRTTYGAVMERADALARALVAYGIKRGDRVATLMWNHSSHLEAYFGIPLAGAVIHTLNLRLHPDEICFIATDAKDRLLFIDHVLVPLFDKFKEKAPFEKVIIVGAPKGDVPAGYIDYETFIAGAPKDAVLPELRDEAARGMC
jgi:fatty-acyl-CoA synthase